MSKETVKDLQPFSSEKRPVIAKNFHTKKSLDYDQYSVAVSLTNSHDFAGKEMISNYGQVCSGSDTEDDFFSVKGDFSRSCSIASCRRDSFSTECPPLKDEEEGDSKQDDPCPLEDKKKLAELFQDPFWSDKVDNENPTKLFEFLQNESWRQEIASIHLSDLPNTSTTTTRNIEEEEEEEDQRYLTKMSEQTILYNLSPNKGTSSVPRKDCKHSVKQENAGMSTHHCCFPSLSPRRSYRERRNARAHSN